MIRHILDTEELMEGLPPRLLGLTGKLKTKQGRLGDPRDTIRATGKGIQVIEQDADHFAKTQCHYGQIVAPQTQDRESQQETERGGQQAGQRQRLPEAETKIVIEQGITIGSDGIETHKAQIQQPRQPHLHIEAQPQDHIDEGERSQIHHTTAGHKGQNDQRQQ